MKYYCVKQHGSTDCGPACLATIAKQFRRNVSIAKIRQYTGTDKQGTTIYGMIRAAEQMGFQAKAVHGEEKSLHGKFPLPCIAHMEMQDGSHHYVVIHKISGKRLIVADPNKGIIKLKIEEFMGRSSSFNQYKWTGNLILLVPKDDFSFEDVKENVIRKFFHFLVPHKKLVLFIFVASLIYTILGIMGAFYFKALIDDILPDSMAETLTIISIGIIFLNIFRVLLELVRNHLMVFLSQKLDVSLIFGFYRHVIKLPMEFFFTREIGEIVARSTDAVQIRELISGATLTLMIDTVMAVAGGIILYMESPTLFRIACFMVISYFVIFAIFDKSYKRQNMEYMEENSRLTSYVIETINGIQTIKSYNAEENIEIETEGKFVKLMKSFRKVNQSRNTQTALKSSVELIGGVILLWIGGIDVLKGEMTIGQLVTFHSLLVYFLEPIKNLVNLQPQLQTAIVAAERLDEVLGLECEKTEREEKKLTVDTLAGDIVFKDVNFRYGSRKRVLEDINLVIKKGQKVGFVGESGSGKTTLSKLLLHLYSVETGEIMIDGINIDDIKIDILREKIAYVSQETFLFSGSIYDNLVLGKNDATLEEVIEASKLAQAEEFIKGFNYKYDTKLSENGSNLSGGQRQRLAIARAMIRKPDIFILDEATSNLDSITEKLLDETLEEYCKGITTIFIAHRLSTIKKCDIIFVMDKGRIIESGSHSELVQLGGKYAELVKQQSLESDR